MSRTSYPPNASDTSCRNLACTASLAEVPPQQIGRPFAERIRR
ncbi:hypothetical protein ABZ892_07450 [Streptomyces sp. NPDC046924]